MNFVKKRKTEHFWAGMPVSEVFFVALGSFRGLKGYHSSSFIDYR